MRRGTTQPLTYHLDNANVSDFENWSITVQGVTYQLVKRKGDETQTTENSITITITPEEMLKFNDGEIVEVQLKALIAGETYATDITRDHIERILDEVALWLKLV